jgi:hypothetical protein
VWLGALWPAAIGVVTLATLALAQLGAIESRLQVAD